jgi:hypothetical protein
MLNKTLLIGVLLVAFPVALVAQEKAADADKSTVTKTEVKKAPSAAASDGGGGVHKYMTWERFSTVFVIALLVIIVALLMMIRSDLERYHTKTGPM